MKNRYEIRGDITVIYLNRKNGEPIETIISTSALERANEFPGAWCAYYHYGKYYVRGNIRKPNGQRTSTQLHVWLMQPQNGEHIDHIDRNPLNNTWENLRFATHGDNMQNKDVYKSNKSSGVRGITWDKEHGMWRTSVQLNGRRYHLGRYKDLEEAKKVVHEFRLRHMPYSSDANVAPDPNYDYLNDLSQFEPKPKKSHYYGVTKYKRTEKWVAYARLDGKSIYLGSFDHEIAASIARDIALFKHYGPNLPNNMKFNHPDLFNESTLTWEKVDTDPQLRQLYRRTS
jgi:hypothetical protein